LRWIATYCTMMEMLQSCFSWLVVDRGIFASKLFEKGCPMFCCFPGVQQNPSFFEYMVLTEDAKAPMQASPDAAAVDLFCPRPYTICPQERVKIPIEIAITPPHGTYARTVSRSGLAMKHGLFIPADCIDPDYRGGIHVCLFHFSDTTYQIKKHERIASIVFEKYVIPKGRSVTMMDDTCRGNSGFGSTGRM